MTLCIDSIYSSHSISGYSTYNPKRKTSFPLKRNNTMALDTTYTYLIVAPLFFCIFISLLIKNGKMLFSSSPIPLDWPVLGMLPGVILNHQRFTLWCTKLLLSTPSSTLRIKGPWLSNMDILLTSNPTNIQHIFCKKHLDFHKGSRFNEIFDYLGDGIFNTDGDLWKYQRKIALTSFTNPRLRQLMASSLREKLEHELAPFLEKWMIQGEVIDLQDIFARLTSDLSSIMLMGHDPKSLRFDLPSHFLYEVGHLGEEVILKRHLLPESIWKFQRWVGFGKEGSLKRVMLKVDEFIYDIIDKKREDVKRMREDRKETNQLNSIYGSDDLFTLYMEEDYGRSEHGFKSSDSFLRDTFVTFSLAGRDTVSSALSWFFWLLSKNPRVEAKIKEEMIEHKVSMNEGKNNVIDLLFQAGEEGLGKLVYLHATIYEALRLYPPVPINHRAAYRESTLPTGHKVSPHTIIATCAHAMGRMEELWGKDCLEFKPERWITEQGTVRNEPTHKFLVFNAGPRICIGKDISILQMKAVILTLLGQNFRFKVVDGHPIEPDLSVVLHMKHGLKVKVMKD